MPEEKNKSIEETMKVLNKKHHSDSVVHGDKMAKNIESIDTGCHSLNKIFGCGGLPRGRIIECYGAESSGKSSMAMYLIGVVQKNGGKALLVDAEQAFSQEYAKKIGVDTDKLIVSQCYSGEEGLDIVEKMVVTGKFDLVVVDSVAALVPLKELEGDISDVTIALQARMMSRHLRVVTGIAAKTKTCLIYINQTRETLMRGWGPKTTTTGGKALKFYASVRLEVKVISKLKDKDDSVIGNRLKIEAKKNKCGLPFKTAELDLYFERGIDTIGDLFDVAVQQEIITKTGNSYAFGETKLGAGRDNAKKYVEDHPGILKELKTKLK